ncbi:CapA family protein [Pengzhenrongella frigida]|uniref:CapA family protein n=1 Tax=Pengzhenrongella frigida TaxID=1259133 RepID=A0A4Q5N1P8_9MICO|nr:CapA family protein [Cellulomonas sp. HLT2-17]RYV52102.1 CapA family protein [Cellulomonas sp. HLT2-17]
MPQTTRPTTTLALAGDTMLGRGVAEHLASDPVRTLFGEELLELVSSADGMLLNLECCLSERGEPWPDRVFHFRGPSSAVDALTLLGVRCVTLANNHALDFGPQALLDTLSTLRAAGIAVAGAGEDQAAARTPARLRVGPLTVTVVSVTDHPAEYAATPDRPGVAHVDLHDAVPAWLTAQVTELAAAGAGPVLVSPHWGPNLTREPPAYVRRAAATLVAAGATLIAGHSAHVFHGVGGRVLFDLGDFLDDYAVHPGLRNDLGLLWLLTFDDAGLPRSAEAVPLRLTFSRTTLAHGEDAGWISQRLRAACRALGTDVTDRDGRLRVELER